MAYTIYQDRIGEIKAGFDNTGHRTYTTMWTVNFDSVVADPKVVATLPEVPPFYAIFAPDPFALLTKIDPQQTEDPATWNIVFTWSTVQRDQNQMTDNPLTRPPRVRWTGREFEKPLIYDAINNTMVCNSAGDPFNPPLMIEDSRQVAIITQNVSSPPSYLVDYRNKVNNAPFTLEGVSIDLFCARIKSLELSEWKVEFGYYFRELQIVIEIKDNELVSNFSSGVGDPADSGTPAGTATVTSNITVSGWQIAAQDAGYRELKYNSTTSAWELKKIVDANGIEVSQAQLLNGKGKRLAAGTQPGGEVYRIWNGYYSRDFSILNLPP